MYPFAILCLLIFIFYLASIYDGYGDPPGGYA